MDANLHEQMLVKGEVDAITGFITSAVPSLNALGVKTADIAVMRYDALKLRDRLINMGVETERLKLYVKERLLTPNVKANGFSAVNTKKLDAQIADVMEAFNVKASMTSASLYTDRFLPPKAERLPPAWKE